MSEKKEQSLREKLMQLVNETEPESEEKKEEKQVESIKKDIAADIAKAVFEQQEKKDKAKKESKEKAAKLNSANASTGKIEVSGYKKAFYTKKDGKQMLVEKAVAEDCQKWFKAVASHNYDNANALKTEIDTKYVTKNGLEPMNQTVAADGGVLVPTVLANFIVEIKEDVAKMKKYSNTLDMTGSPTNTFTIPKELGAPKVFWEGVEQYDSDKSTTSSQYESQSLTPYTVATITAITNQLIADSPFNMIKLLTARLGRALATEEDKVAIVGTGTSQPTGISTYTPSATVNAGGNLAFNHLNTAYWSMREQYRNSDRTFWIMNSSRMALIQGLRDSNNRPIYIDATLSTELPKLNNIRVLENNNVANNRIYLVNLDYYYWAFKDGVAIDIADQASVGTSDPVNLWQRNMKAVRAEQRYDAELVDTRALVSITSP